MLIVYHEKKSLYVNYTVSALLLQGISSMTNSPSLLTIINQVFVYGDLSTYESKYNFNSFVIYRNINLPTRLI